MFRPPQIFGTFEMGTQGKGTGDMKCFSGYTAMKECCLADKVLIHAPPLACVPNVLTGIVMVYHSREQFGNCAAGPSRVQAEGPFIENILANAGYSTLTGMTSWKNHVSWPFDFSYGHACAPSP